MWILEFIVGIVFGWLLLSKEFWHFIFQLIFGRKVKVYEEPFEDEEDQIEPVKPVKKDLSHMPKKELAELLRNSKVRVVKK